MSSPIGIFDSGFGGLTVMRAIRNLMPRENILYFGDTARVPYGNNTIETIIRYATEVATFLSTQPLKILIVACHTASAAALEHLRTLLPIPIIGILEPGAEEVSRTTQTGRIAILGTRSTIASGFYQQHVATRLPHAQLAAIACPLFVPLVEEGYTTHPLAQLAVQEYLSPLKNNVDTVLLGCTHYPLLQSLIQQELGPSVTLIDPATTCAEIARQLLDDKGLLNTEGTPPQYQFYVTDNPEKFRLLGKLFLDHPIEDVTCVQL